MASSSHVHRSGRGMTHQVTFVIAVALLPFSVAFSSSNPGKLSPSRRRTTRRTIIDHHVARRWPIDLTRKMSSQDKANDDDNKIFEPFGVGVKRDFQRRLPYYKSDIADGLNAQCLATTLFLFFACAAPAIGFGGILDAATGGAVGAVEMVASTALCGVVYALAAPQPLQLIGPMGPNLAFTISLAQLAKQLSLPFLPVYAWTGLWTSGLLFLAALTSASNIIKYLTRFTDEIFSVLISTIFLFEAITSVATTFTATSSSSADAAVTALLSLTCATITFGTALALRGLKTSHYLTASLRNNLSNFAPAIGVLAGSLTARAARIKYGAAAAALPVLKLPSQFTTTTGRPWWIPVRDLPLWARWACALPAALATVLLFLDQNITARLVNNPRYKMTKGHRTSVLDGMNGDMFVLAALTGFASVLGLPWMAGATTRSAAHVRSLSLVDDAGGVEGTLENRVSGTAIHALIGACVFFAPPRHLLAQVPLPVLSGVFMYLGFTSLQGLELWDRMRGLLQDVTDSRWSSVARSTTTIYTGIQMACVAVMMWVTKSEVGVISPLLIALLPLLRLGLIKSGLVNKESMDVLDS